MEPREEIKKQTHFILVGMGIRFCATGQDYEPLKKGYERCRAKYGEQFIVKVKEETAKAIEGNYRKRLEEVWAL